MIMIENHSLSNRIKLCLDRIKSFSYTNNNNAKLCACINELFTLLEARHIFNKTIKYNVDNKFEFLVKDERYEITPTTLRDAHVNITNEGTGDDVLEFDVHLYEFVDKLMDHIQPIKYMDEDDNDEKDNNNEKNEKKDNDESKSNDSKSDKMKIRDYDNELDDENDNNLTQHKEKIKSKKRKLSEFSVDRDYKYNQKKFNKYQKLRRDKSRKFDNDDNN